jgi:hypothetical protein
MSKMKNSFGFVFPILEKLRIQKIRFGALFEKAIFGPPVRGPVHPLNEFSQSQDLLFWTILNGLNKTP